MSADRQPSPLRLSELQPPLAQLPSKDPILFDQIRDSLPLLSIQPAGEDGEHHLENRCVDHGRSL
jgi:hypothetical protein